MQFRCLVLLLPALASAADWNPRAAADYLDARQQQWFAWSGANANAKPCVSCHTGLPYLLARPALRRVLHESGPTLYETGLLDSLRGRVALRDPKEINPRLSEPHGSEAAGVEAIFAAFFLRTPAALDRMWALQGRDGAWAWNSYNLQPWEMPNSAYFGAALAALAARDSKTPAAERLRSYLSRELFHQQPLHNSLMAVWAGAVSDAQRKEALDQLWSRQNSDGSWALAALGPWRIGEAADYTDLTHTFATAFAAAVAQEIGIPRSDPRLARALAWLRARQDAKGYWEAASLNHDYPKGSMQEGFMRDATTAWAALALCGVE